MVGSKSSVKTSIEVHFIIFYSSSMKKQSIGRKASSKIHGVNLTFIIIHGLIFFLMCRVILIPQQ